MEHLGAGHLAPDVSRAELAEVQFALHLRVRLLDGLVGHRNGDDRDESGDSGEGDPEEGHTTERVHLGVLGELLAIHFLSFFGFSMREEIEIDVNLPCG
jgi:hypothetical protein